MFGRQQLFLHPRELAALRHDYRAHAQAQKAAPLDNYQFGEYADRFCREFLSVKTLETLDYSAYEGATLIHDMNTAVEARLHGRFDAVIEAGSLEHIFHFPVAIRNLMVMTKAGGSVFLTTVANNLCGHGFYQFSPELIYRVFSPENGFEQPKVVLLEGSFPWVELTPYRAAYQVADPAEVGGRVGLQTCTPVMMMVDAKKIRDVEPFRATPQQSDYVAAWQGDAPAVGEHSQAAPRNSRPHLLKRIFDVLPAAWQRQIQGWRSKRQCSFQNHRFYRKLAG
jgi:hypothetical protein